MIRPLPEGWRLSEPYSEMRDPKHFKRMLEESMQAPRPEKPVIPETFNGKKVSELSDSEKELFYLSLQTESTRLAIENQKKRKPEDDLEWVLRPMPACLANPEAKNKDELVSKRGLEPQEVTVVEGMRRQSKNTLGTSELSSVTEEARERAIHGFTYSKPAEPSVTELRRLKKLVEVEAIRPAEAPTTADDKREYKLTMLEKMRLWFNSKFGDWIN